MPMAGMNSDAKPADEPARAEPAARSSRLLRGLGRSAASLLAIMATALALGFLVFVGTLPAAEVKLARDADGIVVLTGGASRITDAIELLAAGRGRRLLISGANPATNRAEIMRLNPEFERVVRCCVDFDRSINTLGNAVETRRWAKSSGFRSLIVVTSSYHMPRAMAEIAHQLPDVALVAFPVVTEKLKADPWWSSTATLRLLGSEYLKYLFSKTRMSLNPTLRA
jgi:uncharacterized SAM-binding protein YcdF (DUF218 family)